MNLANTSCPECLYLCFTWLVIRKSALACEKNIRPVSSNLGSLRLRAEPQSLRSMERGSQHWATIPRPGITNFEGEWVCLANRFGSSDPWAVGSGVLLLALRLALRQHIKVETYCGVKLIISWAQEIGKGAHVLQGHALIPPLRSHFLKYIPFPSSSTLGSKQALTTCSFDEHLKPKL